MRVTRLPFHNMQQLYLSDYTLSTVPGSAFWDAFKYGDDLWQQIYKDKLKPFEEYYNKNIGTDTSSQINWLLLDLENAVYLNYFDIAWVIAFFVSSKPSNNIMETSGQRQNSSNAKW